MGSDDAETGPMERTARHEAGLVHEAYVVTVSHHCDAMNDENVQSGPRSGTQLAIPNSQCCVSVTVAQLCVFARISYTVQHISDFLRRKPVCSDRTSPVATPRLRLQYGTERRCQVPPGRTLRFVAVLCCLSLRRISNNHGINIILCWWGSRSFSPPTHPRVRSRYQLSGCGMAKWVKGPMARTPPPAGSRQSPTWHRSESGRPGLAAWEPVSGRTLASGSSALVRDGIVRGRERLAGSCAGGATSWR